MLEEEETEEETDGQEVHTKKEREINLRIRGTDKMLSLEDKDDEKTKQHLIRIFINVLMCPRQQKTRMN